jgi:hypothetical protein
VGPVGVETATAARGINQDRMVIETIIIKILIIIIIMIIMIII